jgi:hypothetical protein
MEFVHLVQQELISILHQELVKQFVNKMKFLMEPIVFVILISIELIQYAHNALQEVALIKLQETVKLVEIIK